MTNARKIEVEAPPSFRRLHEIIVRYETLSLVKDVPGSLIQVGVGSGFGLIVTAMLLDVLSPFSTDATIVGFDSFGEAYPAFEPDEAEIVAEFTASQHNRFGTGIGVVEELMEQHRRTTVFPNRACEKIELVKGLVEVTIPAWEAKGRRLRYLELDINVRSGTACALEHLWPLLVPGGVCVFGGFAAGPWEGESQVVQKFIEERCLEPRRIHGLTYPSAYVRK